MTPQQAKGWRRWDLTKMNAPRGAVIILQLGNKIHQRRFHFNSINMGLSSILAKIIHSWSAESENGWNFLVHHWPWLIIWKWHFLGKFCQIWVDKRVVPLLCLVINMTDWVSRVFFQLLRHLVTAVQRKVSILLRGSTRSKCSMQQKFHRHISAQHS